MIMRNTLVLILCLLVLACTSKRSSPVAKEGVYYTCSMDPQVHEPHPGKCPICKMELTPVTASVSAGNDELVLSEQQVALGNIRVDSVTNGSLNIGSMVAGTIAIDPSRNQVISSRLMGRIEHLYYRIEGEKVPAGARLYDLYSEELNTARQEYLLLLEKKATLGNSVINYDQLIEAAKTKLKLWGMSDQQIAALATSKSLSTVTPFYASGPGVITTVNVKEGDYVMQGASIMELSDLSSVWIELQPYLSEASQFTPGSAMEVTVPGIDKTFSGKVEFMNPEVSGSSRVNLVRLSLRNPDGKLKPGMPAYARTKKVITGKLLVPMAAVIRERSMNWVWIQTGTRRFKSRMVKLGEESGDHVQVVDGLKEGEQVVVAGAWLLNSEYNLRNGAAVMAGHQH